MKNLSVLLIKLIGCGLIAMGISFRHLIVMAAGFTVLIFAPFLNIYVLRLIDPKVGKSEKYHRQKIAKKKLQAQREIDKEKIGFEFFKQTFLFAGHLAALDGKVCASERQQFDKICHQLQLNPQQRQAASDYFKQGGKTSFDSTQSLQRFIKVCGDVDVLRENFLQTQFSFARANGQVSTKEFQLLENISRLLKADKSYHYLLQEFRKDIELQAEEKARETIEKRKQQRDKKRHETKKQRQNQQKKQQTKPLSAAQRELQQAFAVLGIQPTKDSGKIKRAYREQIKRHHPDYLLSKGYPEALLREATERSVKINAAYRLLKKTIKRL